MSFVTESERGFAAAREARSRLGLGLEAPLADALLLIEDVITISQQTTSVTVAFDDVAVADFFEQQVDQIIREREKENPPADEDEPAAE